MAKNTSGRAEESAYLISEVTKMINPWIKAADDEVESHDAGKKLDQSSLIEPNTLPTLERLMSLDLPSQGSGQAGLLSSVESVLKHSVNTFCPGFLDKLVACTNPPGLASELLLSALNTNVHVYRVSPALTAIEKRTTKELARLFGLTHRNSGGISVQGGSASNLTSLVIARNNFFPNCKQFGINGRDGTIRNPVLFTSSRAHYSFEKAAQVCGLGSNAAIGVPANEAGQMNPPDLERLIKEAISRGQTPFYVAATAGTTVLGAFDPLPEIAAIARSYGMWFHIDAAWGGGFVFSNELRTTRLRGSELADSIGFNPHKMLGVPATCSFLLARDLKQFHQSNSLPAGYLFHNSDNPENDSIAASPCDTSHSFSDSPIDIAEVSDSASSSSASTWSNADSASNSSSSLVTSVTSESDSHDKWTEPDDLGDLTLQCGRRGDSLKMFLSWQYYGTEGYRSKVENAHSNAQYIAHRLSTVESDQILFVSPLPTPCLQVCFYYAPGGELLFPSTTTSPSETGLPLSQKGIGLMNSKVTREIAESLLRKGFMIDYAPASEGGQPESNGEFFRLVVHIETSRGTLNRLVDDLLDIGKEVVAKEKNRVGLV